MKLVEKSYVNGGGEQAQEGALDECDIRMFPMFGDGVPGRRPASGRRPRRQRSGGAKRSVWRAGG